MSTPAPTLVILIGPPAVGKMTIGQALARLTGMRLFFNHQIIDLLTEYLEFGTPEFEDVTHPFYTNFMRSTAQAGVSLIITWGWRFDIAEDTERVAAFVQPYLDRGGRVCAVELHTPFEVRLQRNQTENRRAHKKTEWATDEWLAHSRTPTATEATGHSRSTSLTWNWRSPS